MGYATAKPEYRAAQAGLKNPKQISMLLPGVVNFANGKGAAQVRKDNLGFLLILDKLVHSFLQLNQLHPLRISP